MLETLSKSVINRKEEDYDEDISLGHRIFEMSIRHLSEDVK